MKTSAHRESVPEPAFAPATPTGRIAGELFGADARGRLRLVAHVAALAVGVAGAPLAWAQTASPAVPLSAASAASQSAASAASPSAASAASPSAASAASDEPGKGLAEIVVTAERRTQNLQTVPIAATALSGAALEKKAVLRMADLQFASPSLTVSDAGLSQSINIRGIGIASGDPSVANGVGYYINGVFQPPVLTQGTFYDIANVEVLRGPQGTLVGSNSTGGAVFVTSVKPELGKLGGYLQGSYGNYNATTDQGALNVPLTSTLALRFAGSYARHDPYQTDLGPYHNQVDQLDEQEGRISALWKPGDLQVLTHLEWITRNTGGYAYTPVPGTTYATGSNSNPDTVDYNTPVFNHEKGFLADTEVRYTLPDGIVLRSLTGYYNKRFGNQYDITGSDVITDTQNQKLNSLQYTEEFNIISPTGGNVNWILGGYYAHNKISPRILNYTSAPTSPTYIYDYNDKFTTGVFGQLNVKLTDKLELQSGLRWSHYTVYQTGEVAIGYGGLFGPNGREVSNLTGSEHDSRMTGKVDLNYQIDHDNLVYAFAARGYKPGGVSSAVLTFAPETVWDYEAGWKSTLLDNHLRTQVGGFYMNYSNFQFDSVDPSDGISGVYNVTHSTIYGVEGQVQAKIDRFDFDSGFAYVHSHLAPVTIVNERYLPGGGSSALGPQCPATPTCFNYTPYIGTAGGGPNLYSPTWTFNFGADYRFRLPHDSVLTPRVNYAYVGSQWANYFYVTTTDYLRAHGVWSALLTYDLDRWSVEGYVNNLTNNRYVTGQWASNGNDEFWSAPRTYGVRATVHF